MGDAQAKHKYSQIATVQFAELQRAKARKAQVIGVADNVGTTARTTAKRKRATVGASVAKWEDLDIEQSVLEEARNLELESALRNLAGRKEIASGYFSARRMLDALKTHDGLVNKAKDALLGST